MAKWIKAPMKLSTFIGILKDQVSLSRSSLYNGIDAAVIRATQHRGSLPEEQDVKAALASGSGSRMCVAQCVCTIMDRLNTTNSWVVALKSLMLIHRCLYDGGFMFQDQLGVNPARGGHNYLNLSRFKDASSPLAWSASRWIRWYATFIEQWIQTSKNLDGFLDFRHRNSLGKSYRAASLTCGQLVGEIHSLCDLLDVALGWEPDESIIDNCLVLESLRQVLLVIWNMLEELRVRLAEIQTRIGTIRAADASQLIYVCDKLLLSSVVLERLPYNLEAFPSHSDRGLLPFSNSELTILKEELSLLKQHGPALRVDMESQQQRSFSWKISGLPWKAETNSDRNLLGRAQSLSDSNLMPELAI